MTKKKKYIVGMLLLAVLSSLPMQAAGYTKTKKVQYKSLNFYFNGAQKYLASEVINIDGVSYLPVRAFCNAVGLEVSTDSSYQNMYVTNGSNYVSVLSLQTELRAKEYEIAALKKELEAFKTTSSTSYRSSSSSSSYDRTKGTDILGSEITDTRKALEREYEDYFDDIDLDFSLSLSSSKLKLTISYDTSSEHEAFKKLSSSKVKSFIEKVCEDIRDRHDDIVIQGVINYTRNDSNQYQFTYSKKDALTYGTGKNITESEVEDIAEDVDRLDMDGYGGTIKVKKVDASVSDSNERVTFMLYLDITDDMKSIWNSHKGTNNDTDLRNDLKSLAKEIYEETDYKVQGILYDYSTNTRIATYDYSNNELYIYSF